MCLRRINLYTDIFNLFEKKRGTKVYLTQLGGNNFIIKFLTMTTPQRTIIVGDIHGCLIELKDLLEKCKYTPQNDRLIFVGDLVGKGISQIPNISLHFLGPDSNDVVRFAIENNVPCVCGNHDDKVIQVYEQLKKGENPVVKDQTHLDCAKNLTEDEYLWLKRLPYYLELDVIFLVLPKSNRNSKGFEHNRGTRWLSSKYFTDRTKSTSHDVYAKLG